MTYGDERGGGAELSVWAHETRARSAAARMQAHRAAESAALIRERVERMFDRIAELNPQQAGPLRAIRVTAARRRAGIVACRHGCGAAVRPGDGLPSRPRDEPGATVVSGAEAYLRDMALTQERDRVAGELQDKIIRRLVAAGLILDGATGLTTQPHVRLRIESAADELDEVIRLIRSVVFNRPGQSGSYEPSGGQTPPATVTSKPRSAPSRDPGGPRKVSRGRKPMSASRRVVCAADVTTSARCAATVADARRAVRRANAATAAANEHLRRAQDALKDAQARQRILTLARGQAVMPVAPASAGKREQP